MAERFGQARRDRHRGGHRRSRRKQPGLGEDDDARADWEAGVQRDASGAATCRCPTDTAVAGWTTEIGAAARRNGVLGISECDIAGADRRRRASR